MVQRGGPSHQENAYHDPYPNDRALLRSKSLAGYLTTAKGRQLAFAMFVNDVPLPQGVTPSREGKVLGRLCELIYQDAP
jgi:D-alanyl-D-alanine carboxypeptidase/D-alanyl-D-alanine-endopeptidase (penicillin-binding protein 4)